MATSRTVKSIELQFKYLKPRCRKWAFKCMQTSGNTKEEALDKLLPQYHEFKKGCKAISEHKKFGCFDSTETDYGDGIVMVSVPLFAELQKDYEKLPLEILEWHEVAI